MKYTIAGTLVLFLFLICYSVNSQSDTGIVPFDCPDVSSPEFQFDLDANVIERVMEDPTSDIAPLFKSVDNLYLRNYRNRAGNFKKMIQYYSQALKERGWHALGQYPQTDPEKISLHLHVLLQNETVKGIFIIVKDKGGIYLINIVCEMPKRQLGELLLNLNQLGIEIPRLMSLKQRDLEFAPPPPPSEPLKPDTDPPITEKRETTEPTIDETPEPPPLWDWYADGERIHEVQIQSKLISPEGTDPKLIEETIVAERDKLLKILRNGSGELREVIPVLAGALDDSRKVSLRITEEGAKRIAIISVISMQKISMLKSMKISGKREQVTVEDTWFLSQEDQFDTPLAATRFWARDVPIHEVRIRGNQKVPKARIRQTLDNASPDIDKALRTLFKVMPLFEEVHLQVDETDAKYIATISVEEKPLSTDAYLGLSPPLRLGFNRVTGWEIGTGFEVGKRKDVGPLWMWNIRNSQGNQISRLFGKVSYAFGNPHIHYRLGGIANWGKPYTWNLGITGQLHRLTDAVAPELFPGYNSGIRIFQRIIGVPDFQNYYLRQGAEIRLYWAPIMPTHSFRVSMLAESHRSLEKSTDWFIANWTSKLSVRGNPPITAGQLRGLVFQYDFLNRTKSLGWHNTFLAEHSRVAVGSDFDFTRLQLHLRYAFPLEKNRIRTRLLLSYSNSPLPIQRQFVIGGMGGLRGYPWYRQEDESDGIITYESGHTASPYAFAGDRGFLLNIEYHYSLSNLLSRGIFKNAFLIAFLDEGQVWNVSDDAYTFNPKASVGIGLQFGEDDSVFRVNIAKALESGIGVQITTAWYHSF
ncbi:BamA/TamA family outer membrane protein [Candidatus Poribacteria bacterium]|nr:BamA/TamA family outer membrane protein [Candidatus Poribacteria bacterium]MYK93652.1 BamA/TamA family outer membrane protein [Candidatus Poribacteria bacterium]